MNRDGKSIGKIELRRAKSSEEQNAYFILNLYWNTLFIENENEWYWSVTIERFTSPHLINFGILRLN